MTDVAALVRELRDLQKRSNYFNARGPHTAYRSRWGVWADALEETERLVQAWEGAVRRTRLAYPENVFRPGPPYRTTDAQSADWARRVCDNIIAEAKEIFEASETEQEEKG